MGYAENRAWWVVREAVRASVWGKPYLDKSCNELNNFY